MKNKRRAVLVGIFEGYARKMNGEGKPDFTVFKINCTMPHDRYKVFVKIKAGGKFAREIINESQRGAIVQIEGYIDSQKVWKRDGDHCDKCGDSYEGVVSVFEQSCSVKFLSGHKSDVGDIEDYSEDGLSNSLKRSKEV